MKKNISKILKNKKTYAVLAQIIFALVYRSITFAATANPLNIYSNPTGGTGELKKTFSGILWIIIACGIAAGVIMIAVIGVKYIWESPEGKADIKKQATMYIVGAVLLISGSTWAAIAMNLAYKISE